MVAGHSWSTGHTNQQFDDQVYGGHFWWSSGSWWSSWWWHRWEFSSGETIPWLRKTRRHHQGLGRQADAWHCKRATSFARYQTDWAVAKSHDSQYSRTRLLPEMVDESPNIKGYSRKLGVAATTTNFIPEGLVQELLTPVLCTSSPPVTTVQ